MGDLLESPCVAPLKKEKWGMNHGGKCWFGSFWRKMLVGVESKSFEISLESVKGKVFGKIVKRGRGYSSWIRFGERGLAWLLEGVETCYKGKFREPFRRVWNEGGRGYKLEELHSNKAGRFLFYTVLYAREKRFSLVFP